jgi:hypothetical protein
MQSIKETVVKNGDRGQYKPHGEAQVVEAPAIVMSSDGESLLIAQSGNTVIVRGRDSLREFLCVAARSMGRHVEDAVEKAAQFTS